MQYFFAFTSSFASSGVFLLFFTRTYVGSHQRFCKISLQSMGMTTFTSNASLSTWGFSSVGHASTWSNQKPCTYIQLKWCSKTAIYIYMTWNHFPGVYIIPELFLDAFWRFVSFWLFPSFYFSTEVWFVLQKNIAGTSWGHRESLPKHGTTHQGKTPSVPGGIVLLWERRICVAAGNGTQWISRRTVFQGCGRVGGNGLWQVALTSVETCNTYIDSHYLHIFLQKSEKHTSIYIYIYGRIPRLSYRIYEL